MPDSNDLKKLAAKSLIKPCKDFLGQDNPFCDSVVADYVEGRISMDDMFEKMGQVFQHHEKIEKK